MTFLGSLCLERLERQTIEPSQAYHLLRSSLVNVSYAEVVLSVN